MFYWALAGSPPSSWVPTKIHILVMQHLVVVVTGFVSTSHIWSEGFSSSIAVFNQASVNRQENMDDDVLTTLKILIIGESGVGKSR